MARTARRNRKPGPESSKGGARRSAPSRASQSNAPFRIACYQGPCVPGDTAANITAATRLLAEAHERGAHFAVMPECYLSGYGAPDVLQSAALDIKGEPFRRWVRSCRFGDMVSIVGFVERRGRRLHNSAAIVQRGRLIGVYRKSMPGSPHEQACVTYMSRFPVWRALGVTFGVIICVEGSSPEPSMILAERGARIIFEPHYAFVSHKGMNAHRVRVRNSRVARAVENQVWFVRSNISCGPDEKMADEPGLGYGDSLILDHLGVPRAEAGLFTHGWIYADAPRESLLGKREPRIPHLPKTTRVQIATLYR